MMVAPTDTKYRAILIFSLFGVLIFLVFSTLAMLVYTGGSRVDDGQTGYSFFKNVFSDLGRMIGYNGEDNILSAVFFMTAFSALSISTIAFYIALTTMIKSPVGLTAGLIGGLLIFIVTFLPEDILPITHLGIAGLAVIAIFISSVALAMATKPPQSYIFIIFTIFTSIYLVQFLFHDPVISSTLQKFFIYLLIVLYFIQTYVLLQRQGRPVLRKRPRLEAHF